MPAVRARSGGRRRREDRLRRFSTFSEGAHGELRAEVERLYRRGAEGLVLDLRDNGGGLLNEAVLSTSIFLDHGNVVSTRSRTQGDQDYPATGDAIEPRPTAVLVDRDTASAAEILTAALQQNDLADVVGTRTYGKGTFQEIMDLTPGGALDLTIGEYLTSDGTSILGEGVKPNVRVEDDPGTETDDEALDRALAGRRRKSPPAGLSRFVAVVGAPRPLPRRRAVVRARRPAGRDRRRRPGARRRAGARRAARRPGAR